MQTTQVYDYRKEKLGGLGDKVLITMEDDKEIEYLISILEDYTNASLNPKEFTLEENFASELKGKLRQVLVK